MLTLSSTSKITIRGGWFSCQTDGNLLFWNHRGQSLLIKDRSGIRYKLAKLLEANMNFGKICDELNEEFCVTIKDVRSLIKYFDNASLVEDLDYRKPSNWLPGELEYYDRQFLVFGGHTSAPHSRYDVHTLLRDATVLIVGVGGTGSWLTLLLGRSGIGTLKLADGDKVEFSNLNRQVLFECKDVGKLKVDAAKEHILEANPYVKVEAIPQMLKSSKDFEKLMGGVDVVVLTVGSLNSELCRMVAKTCVRANMPHLFLNGKAIGPFWMPNEKDTACYGCVEVQLKSEIPDYEKMQNAWTARQVNNHGAFAPFIAPAAVLSGLEISKYLSRIAEPATKNKIIKIDFDNLNLDHDEFFRHEDCQICRSTGDRNK